MVKYRCNRGSLSRSLLTLAEATASRALGDNRLDHFISPSQFLRDKLVQYEVVEPEDITVLPYGINLQAFAPEEGTRSYLLYFGRLAPVKGIMTLLDAIAPLRHVPLRIVGRGPLEAAVRERIESQGLDHVTLLGHQSKDSVKELIRDSFATCVPSEWYENYPLSIMESMAMARPVIGTRIGGIPEMIAHEKDGLLVTPGHPGELREAIAALARDGDQCKEMGLAARRRALRHWDVGGHIERLETVYRQVST